MAKKGSSNMADFGFTMLGSEEATKAFAISDWIGTGSYNLNRIISGSLFKGIPNRRITGFIGEESVGKTLFALCIAREAQKKGYKVAFFDSENALTPDFAKAAGIEIDDLMYSQVLTIEEFRRNCLDLIEWKSNTYGMDQQLLVILDSFGGLIAKKFVKDIEDGKDTSDMGIFAKIAKATMKMLGNLLSKHNVTIVYTNHVYADNSGYVPVIQQTGGMASRYYPSTVILLKKKLVRDSEKKVTGINIVAQNTKSRIAPMYQTAEIYLDWQKGIDPTAGLFNIMCDIGWIKSAGGWWSMGDEKFRRSEVEEIIKGTEHLERLEEYIKSTGFNTIEQMTDQIIAYETVKE